MKCEDCGFPFATSSICPNCNSKNPGGKIGCFGLILIGGALVLIFGGLKTCSNDSSSSAAYRTQGVVMDSATTSADPFEEQEFTDEGGSQDFQTDEWSGTESGDYGNPDGYDNADNAPVRDVAPDYGSFSTDDEMPRDTL